MPHAPWDCQFNPSPDWETRWCPECGWSGLNVDCPEHGWLVPLADGLVIA